ncbi:Bug family tripartite tricarboxylate transporter substrate binding protein [Caldimonas manganoxidans]|uniref:Bug family tripartite tricarboxylate transporter substrate binding protein n=1 Tax=Caldimonas manganoxidans TaxID=196015 RepID=UPI000374BEEE|nr:tripartite tricarboxylate transporter substrate binding protein [Caldimonas manganoxidans]
MKTSTSLAGLIRRALCAALLGVAAAASVPAQDYPTQPIRLIVSFPPGGAADVIGRTIANGLGEAFKQTIVVENRPGANGNIGADAVAKAAPDGYTLLMSSGGTVTANPFLFSKMSFDPEKDLTPVASAAVVRPYLMVHPSLPVNTVQEFIAYARANPGKLSYGSAGNGSSLHLAGEMLKRDAKIEATHVPYRGAAPALNDLLAGQVHFMFDSGPGLKHAQAGKLKLLAVGSAQRSPQVPHVPTLAESGLPGFDADTVFGVYAPAGTPTAIVNKLNAEINKVLRTPQAVAAIHAIGADILTMSVSEFVERQRAERARMGAFIKQAGIKLD